MTHLDGLIFVPSPTKIDGPTYHRRAKIAARLEEQAKLLDDPSFVATDKRWTTGEGGKRSLVERPRRIRQWWQKVDDGKYVLSVYYGHRRVEFEKGKSGIELSSLDAVRETIGKLTAAVMAGELDSVMNEASVSTGTVRRQPVERSQTSKVTKKVA